MVSQLSPKEMYNAKHVTEPIDVLLGKKVSVTGISFYNDDVDIKGTIRENAKIACMKLVDEDGTTHITSSPSPTFVSCAEDISELFEDGVSARIIMMQPADSKKNAFLSIELED